MAEINSPGSADQELTRTLLRCNYSGITRADLRDEAGQPLTDKPNPVPSYALLYRESIRNRWDVFELDFSQDRTDWTTTMAGDERDSFLGIVASFLHGTRQLETDLPVFMIGATEEHKPPLACEIETQARHMTFLIRFFREAVDVQGTDVMAVLDETFPWVQETFIGPFGLLAHQAEDLRRNPYDARARVRYGTTCFLWIQGTLATSFLSVLSGYVEGRDVLPAFRVGARAVYRDHKLHSRCGTLFLQDALRRDPGMVSEIHDTLRTILTFSGVSSRRPFHEPLSWSEEEMRLLLCSELRRRCDELGITLPTDLENLLVPIERRG